MARQSAQNAKSTALRAQLLLMRIGILSIPVYLLLLSPTCGIFGPYVSKDSSLFAIALAGLIPGLILSLTGVIKNSNLALGVSGVITAIPIIANRMVEPYYAVFDFTLLLLFLEVSTTLTSFSGISKTIEPGNDENVSYNCRLALGEYTKKAMTIMAITLVFCLGAVFFTANLGTQIGVPGIAFLTTITLLIVFVTLALRYGKR